MALLSALVVATACSSDFSDPVPRTRVEQVQRELSARRPAECEPSPTGGFPSDFPPIPLPDSAVLTEPAGPARPGMLRVDLASTLTVRELFRFFLRELRGRPGFVVVSQEFEGVDAEVFFGFGGRVGTIMIVSSCDGAVAAVEAEATDGTPSPL